MRYLGVDYGGKRIGLALSDAEGRIAFPHATVNNLDGVLTVIRTLGVGAVVIGLPLTLARKDSAETRAVWAFADALRERVQLPVLLEDETFTTKIAEAHGMKGRADASAAALILQAYLDSGREKRN